MNDNFRKYQDVFIDLSVNNKTIYLDKIDKSNFFDLYNLNKFNEDSCSDLNDFVFSREMDFLRIIDEPIEWQNLKINNIKEEALKEKQKKLSEIDSEMDARELNEYEVFLDDFYRNQTNKKLEILNDKYSFMVSTISDLEDLSRNFKDNSTLYIGYPFVEGYINEKNYVSMPLFLIPIKLYTKDSSWFIEKDFTRYVEFNSYISIILKKIFGKSYDIKKKYNLRNEFSKETIYEVLNFLKNYDSNLTVNYSFVDSSIEGFTESIHTHKEDKFYLKVKNFMIIGNFKVIEDEFFDYEILINKNFLDNPVFKSMYLNEKSDSNSFEEINNLYIKNALDYTQQQILKCADKSRISLIDSKIGTGKDTTILNFAIDKILRNKKTLIIFKDKPSMENFYLRFGEMQSIVMKLGEGEEFYNKFSAELNYIKTFKKDNEFCESFKALVNEIGEKYSYINEANEVYNNVEKFGLSLQEMYLITMDVTNENFDNESFKKFTMKNPVSGCTFEEIVEVVKKIKDEDIINIFLKNKEYLNKYKILNFIRDDFDISKCREFISKLKDLKDIYNRISLDIDQNECSLKVVELFKSGTLSKKEILNEIVKLKEEDLETSSPKENESWFKGLGFFKGKKACNENGKNYESAKGYYEILNNLIDEISFLDEILKVDIFNFIKEEIYNFNDITEFVKMLIEMLETFYDFLDDSIRMKNFDRVIIDIIEYIYNNSLNESMMRDGLDEILKFSVLINIMRHHHKCGDELMKYKFVNKFIFDLKDLFKRRESEIDKFTLNEVRENALNFISNHPEEKLNSYVDPNYKIKDFLFERFRTFLELFPCVLIDHKSVSSYIPMIQNVFDYVIIDDGHEFLISDVIPHIYRGKRLLVFGDKNQLQYKNKSYNLIHDRSEFVCENLIDFMKDKGSFFSLKYLYYSRSEILNNLSNSLFEKMDIIKAPDLVKFSEMKNPFTLFQINSQLVNGENRTEAEFVVNLIYNILKSKDKHKSIGVVTLTKAHANLISEILYERLKLEEDFSYAYYTECKKYKGDQKNAIYIKSIGEVTSDKRDTIIFSLGGGMELNGSFELNFDEIPEDEFGERKLNIFMSLPISEMKIVSSFNIDEINFRDYGNKNIDLIKDYLNYAKMISVGRSNEVMNEINKSNKLKFFDDSEDIISQIQDRLIKKGLNVIRNYGNSSYKFDLALYDEELKQYILFIDLDGNLMKKFEHLNERNIDFIIYFESFGCSILKLWSKDLWSDFDAQINNIYEVYKNIKENKTKHSTKLLENKG